MQAIVGQRHFARSGESAGLARFVGEPPANQTREWIRLSCSPRCARDTAGEGLLTRGSNLASRNESLRLQ